MLPIYVSFQSGQSAISSSIHFPFIVISYLLKICYSIRSFFHSNSVFFLASFSFVYDSLLIECIGLIFTPVKIVNLPLNYPLTCFSSKNNLYRTSISPLNSSPTQAHQIYDYNIFYWHLFDFFSVVLAIFLLIYTLNDFLNLVDGSLCQFSHFSLYLLVDLTILFYYYYYQHNFSNF